MAQKNQEATCLLISDKPQDAVCLLLPLKRLSELVFAHEMRLSAVQLDKIIERASSRLLGQRVPGLLHSEETLN